MSKTNKGLWEQISQINKSTVHDSVPANTLRPPSPSRRLPHKPQIWAGEALLKQFHRTLGDDGFALMLSSTEITTTTAGAAYIERFAPNPS